MAQSNGFGGRILSVVEVTPGTTPANPALIKFSDNVQSVSISLDPQVQTWRNINNYDVAFYTKGLPVYGLRVSYLLHTDRKTQMDDAINRQSDNAMKSQTIEVSVNLDGATKSYFTFTGAQASDVKVKGEVGKPTMVEISYLALALANATAEPSVGSGSRESAALGALTVFSTSTIRRAAAAVAFITRSAEFSVAQNVESFGTDGQAGPKLLAAGVRAITGTIDISIDDGGSALATTVAALTEATVDFNLGASGAPRVSLTGAVWNSLEVPVDSSSGIVISGVPFTAKSATTGTVA